MLRKIKIQLLLLTGIYFFFFSCTGPLVKNQSEETGKNDFPQIEVYKKVLPNGLTLLFSPRNKIPVFSFYNFVKVGSHYETKGITGSAHFLEHLMFLGGKKYPGGEFDKVMASNGGASNASTDYDLTIYHEDLPTQALDKILDMEADRLTNLALDPIAYEKERNVILEERKMRIENSPQGQILDQTLSYIFKNTLYKESIIGSQEDIETVKVEQIKEFFNQHYSPNNMVMVVVGDFEKEKIFQKLENSFGNLVKNEKLELLKKEFDEPSKYNATLLKDDTLKLHGNSVNPIFFLAMDSVSMKSRESVLLDLLAVMMGHGRSSFLYQNYVTPPKASLSYIQAMNYSLNNAGIFAITGQLIEGKGQAQLDQLEKDLKNKLSTFCTQVITPRNVTKTKNQFLVSYYEGLQKTSEIAPMIGKYEATMGDYSYYLKEIDIINKASVEELQTVCQKMISSKKKIFVTLWNKYPKK